MDDFGDWVIQPNSQCIDLLDTIKLISFVYIKRI